MKRTLLMFGNKNFESIIFENNKMKLTPNKLMAKMVVKNNVINFSNSKMNITKAKDLINLTIENAEVNGIYFALADLLDKSDSLQNFEAEFVDIIHFTSSKNIPLYIYDKLGKHNKRAIDYEELICFLNNNYSLNPVAHRTYELINKMEYKESKVTDLCSN